MTAGVPGREVFERNLARLSRYLPPGGPDVIRAAEPARTVPAGTAGGPNLDLGGTLLYEPDAATFCGAQIEAYLANPQCLSLSPVASADHGRTSDRAIAALHDRFAGEIAPGPRPPDLPAGYLVSFGVGFGLHLPALVGRLPVRNLVLVEQYPAFLAAALSAFDWGHMLDALESRGGRVILLMGERPATIAAGLYNTLRGPDKGLLDGSHLYRHLATPFLDRCIGAFLDMLPVIGDSDGFLEDECLMLRNAAANLAGGPWRVLVDGPSLAEDRPAFVVGSGPSIEGDLDFLAARRDAAIVISGGTALGVLLEAGIAPDLHCEIENVPDIAAATRFVADRHDLSGVTLVAALTVDPRVVGLFGETIFVLRDSLAPTRLFGSPDLTLPMAGPTVTNLACRAAIALGCPEVCLFGVDLGSVDPDRHHAGGSIYSISDDPYWSGGAAMEGFTLPAPGNFRDTVYTSRELHYARVYYQAMAEGFPGTRFRNCSDGVRIAGFEAVRSGELALALRPRWSAAVLRRALPEPAVGREAVEHALGSLHRAFQDTADEIEGRLDALDRANAGVISLYDALRPWAVDPNPDSAAPSDVARFMAAGTLMTVLMAANSAWARVDAGRRRTLSAEVRRILRRALEEMRAEVAVLGAAGAVSVADRPAGAE